MSIEVEDSNNIGRSATFHFANKKIAMYKSGQTVGQIDVSLPIGTAPYITNLDTHEGGFFAFNGDIATGSPVNAGHGLGLTIRSAAIFSVKEQIIFGVGSKLYHRRADGGGGQAGRVTSSEAV